MPITLENKITDIIEKVKKIKEIVRNMVIPTSWQFFRIFRSKIDPLYPGAVSRPDVGRFLIHASYSIDSLKFKPSILAASAITMAGRGTATDQFYTDIQTVTGYTQDQLRECNLFLHRNKL